MKDSIVPKLAYLYNVKGQKTWEGLKVDGKISSKTSEHPNLRRRQKITLGTYV
jgi:hypothetical protein